MSIEFKRSGALVGAEGIPSTVLPYIQEHLEYDDRSLIPDGMGGMKTEVVTRRLWSLREDQLIFPCGFIRSVCRIAERHGASFGSYNRVDGRPMTLPFDLSKVDLKSMREEQREFLKAVHSNEGGLIVSPTGSGKSYFLRELCEFYGDQRILIAAPTVEAVQTLNRYLREKFPRVGQCGGNRRSTERITVSTFDSLMKVDYFDKIDILIVDEVHRAPANKYSTAVSACTSPVKRFGFTATPDGRFDGREIINEGMFGPIIVEYNYADSEKHGNVVPLRVIARENPWGPSQNFIKRCRNQTDKDRAAVWRNDKRNDLIAKDIVELIEVEKNRTGEEPQVLIIVSKAEHLYELRKRLPDFTHVTGKMTPKDVGRLRKKGIDIGMKDTVSDKRRDYLRRQFESGELKRVIATKIWSTAISSNHCSIVSYAAGDGSTIEFSQAKGRASRTNEGKDHSTILLYYDTFANTYQRRSEKLIRAAKKDGHKVELMRFRRT